MPVNATNPAPQDRRRAPPPPDQPVIENYAILALPGNRFQVTGNVTNYDTGTTVTLTGPDAFNGASAVVDENGGFSIIVALAAPTTGSVIAVATNPGGGNPVTSEPVSLSVSP